MKEYPPEFYSKIGGCFMVVAAMLFGASFLMVFSVSRCGREGTQQPAPGVSGPASVTAADSLSAWADSISAITGIGYGPYFYDPSWPLEYSAASDTLLYYPRDSAATHFTIPGTVQVIEERAFQCNNHLVEITLPPGVRAIGACSFYGCGELRKVTIEGPVTSIPWRAFDGCRELQAVDLPASVCSIGGYSFSGCESLRDFIVRNPDPPHFDYEDDSEDFASMGAFFGADLSRCTLHVPRVSVEYYRKAPGWKEFNSIVGL